MVKSAGETNAQPTEYSHQGINAALLPFSHSGLVPAKSCAYMIYTHELSYCMSSLGKKGLFYLKLPNTESALKKSKTSQSQKKLGVSYWWQKLKLVLKHKGFSLLIPPVITFVVYFRTLFSFWVMSLPYIQAQKLMVYLHQSEALLGTTLLWNEVTTLVEI